MPWRKRHHPPDDVFADQRHIVSITICTAENPRWLKVDSLAKEVLIAAHLARLEQDGAAAA